MAIKGVDISNWQKGISVPGIKAAGADFLIAKATEGVDFVDPYCDGFIQAARDSMLTGVYHFARNSQNSAESECDFFLRNIEGYLNVCIPILDWEDRTSDVNWARRFLDRFTDRTGIRPIVYMSASPANEYDWSALWPYYGLWVAGYPGNYDGGPLVAPDLAYSIRGWNTVMWQYTSSASVAGYSVDANVAYLNRDQWAAYATGGKAGHASAPAPSNPTPAPSFAPSRTLGPGSTGEDVKGLQSGLNAVFPAYSCLEVDGIFGNATAEAVMEFQRRSGLAADAYAGPDTQKELSKYNISW